MSPRRTFGTVRQLPSGAYQARYVGPDGQRVQAPTTFQARVDADAWLSLRQADVIRGAWHPEVPKTTTRTALKEYADRWLEQRNLKPRTKAEYRRLLDKQVIPDLGSEPLSAISPDDVRAWYAKVGARTGPTERTHAYQLLRTILGTALTDGLVSTNPCHIRGAGQGKRVRNIRPATLAELEVIVGATPERLRLLVLLATWCAPRFGEITELRRKDIDVDAGVLRIRRAVVRVKGQHIVGTPKSSAGSRDVAIPPHLLPLVTDHLDRFAQPGAEGLLFPAMNGGHLTTMYRSWYAARHLAGRDDLRFHDLRHTGATLAAATGATLAELMADSDTRRSGQPCGTKAPRVSETARSQ
jgi:integrase